MPTLYLKMRSYRQMFKGIQACENASKCLVVFSAMPKYSLKSGTLPPKLLFHRLQASYLLFCLPSHISIQGINEDAIQGINKDELSFNFRQWWPKIQSKS